MQFTLAIVAAFAVTAYGQVVTPAACLPQAAAVPTCALSCISSAASRAGCGQFDLACQCGTASSAINSYAQGCVIGACTPIESAIAVANSAAAVCSCVATAPAGSAAASTTAAASTSAAASSGSSAASSSAAQTSAAASTSAQTTAASTSRAATTVLASQISDGQPQAPRATSIVTGGAANLAALGGVAGAVLGVAALL